MTIEMRHELNVAAINQLLTSPNGGLARDLLRRGKRVETAAKGFCPVDHGRLRSSITTKLVVDGAGLHARIGTELKYALWVEQGTGLYGPHHTRVVPANGKVMVFANRKAFKTGVFIPARFRTTFFVRSTRGMRGTEYLSRALPFARS